jgi:hypothetical protein
MQILRGGGEVSVRVRVLPTQILLKSYPTEDVKNKVQENPEVVSNSTSKI